MSRADLQQWLLGEKAFNSAFNALEIEAVRSQFPRLHSFRSDYDPPLNWPYLLFCASVLSPSNFPAAEEKALRIAQSALLSEECSTAERDAALILLDTLSNRRAIDLAVKREHVASDLDDRLGIAQRIDWVRRSFENRIEFANGMTLFANRFQRRFWERASTCEWISISAPTSAGKSYILAQWLADRLLAGDFHRVVYIAPTRALVQQVENDLRELLANAGVEGVELRSLPFLTGAKKAGREVLIFTQERLHYYLQSFGAAGIDALVIDEAHKVGDSHRGILMQDVIEQVAAANVDARVIFTSPLTDNPELLLADAPSHASRDVLSSDDATVNQNLLWLEPSEEEAKKWNLSLRRGETNVVLGYFEGPRANATIKARLAELAIATDTGDGGILVYANGAADAEELAEEIARGLPEVTLPERVGALDELCSDTIHKDYKLRAVLQKGVAFHYGNMPLLLRTAIEALFRDGHIKYLVCTSTLVEGVNLPCRTILVRAPRKGRTTRMPPADFWNLAGRAGRWGKEFQGNVICVDTHDKEAWGDTLPERRGKYRVERTADRLLADEDRLVDHIRAGCPNPQAGSGQDLETAISYFSAVRAKSGSLLQAPWSGRIKAEKLARVDAALGEALDDVDGIPPVWLRRHAGISPFAMSRMMRALINLKEPIENFLPIDPESENAGDQYGRIFQLVGHHMTNVFGQGGRCNALGILTANWMLGYPIKRLIAERIAWNRRKGKSQTVAAAIRKTLEDVEQIARFQAPRYLACYSDIARVVLLQKGFNEASISIPDLTLPLEFGVRGPVQLSLMSLGLSRSSTLAVAAAVADSLSPEQMARVQEDPSLIAAAIAALPLDDLVLPELIRSEVQDLQQTLMGDKQS